MSEDAPDTRGQSPSDTEKLRLGGMALRNGLLVHGPTHWAAACRRPDGEIAVASGRKPRAGATESIPALRGVARMGQAMAVVPLARRALPAARLPFEDRRVLGAMVVAGAVGQLLRRRAGRTGSGRGRTATEAAVAAISVLPSLIALRDGDLAAYHGAEHKAIAAYEQDAADASEVAKEHDRCGSHLLTPLLVSNLVGGALLRAAVRRPGPVHHALVGLGSVGIAVEVFAWAERHHDSAAARALRVPGHELQRALGTREPTEGQLEVARAALAETLRVEGEHA